MSGREGEFWEVVVTQRHDNPISDLEDCTGTLETTQTDGGDEEVRVEHNTGQ